MNNHGVIRPVTGIWSLCNYSEPGLFGLADVLLEIDWPCRVELMLINPNFRGSRNDRRSASVEQVSVGGMMRLRTTITAADVVTHFFPFKQIDATSS
jgi:hypothetical protein